MNSVCLAIPEGDKPEAIEACVASDSAAALQVLVIGSGPVGVRVANEILDRTPYARVHLFSNEPFQPYNRVQLSSLLAGEVSPTDIELPLPVVKHQHRFTFSIAAVTAIHPGEKRIEDAIGNVHSYDKLIIATGARAHVPHIPGINHQGVYTFRNLKDAESLYGRVARSRHMVVVGGGLLGLEAARGLLRFNTMVTLIQQGSHLMNRQLDEESAANLQHQVEALGIRVITNAGVREILGDSRVTGVKTRSGELISCDTVLLCAGIKPNVELAREARLQVANGIVVDDNMQTSSPDIYAIGECSEHQGVTYGLVNPGYEQASVVADRISGGHACYSGTQTVSRLKVVGEQVVSFGEVADIRQRPMQQILVHRNTKQNIYRKIIIHKGAVIGALGTGAWPESGRLQEAYKSGRHIWRWQQLLFIATGRLWPFKNADDVRKWPASAIVCQCNGVTQGALNEACASLAVSGQPSVSCLGAATGAGMVCGSCKPLLSQMLGDGAKLEKSQGWLWLLVGSLLALAITSLQLLMPEAKVADSVQADRWFESIWNDKFWKQVTGFSLLGMTIIGLLMSLRKRLGFTWMGKFGYWRLLHSFLGVACAAMLIFHTGFHLGENLNQLLMLSFVGVLVLGATAGAVTGLLHRLPAAQAQTIQKSLNYLHIVIAWPLPALLAAHIFSVYYF
ncbi:FAD-dependent oxidoreductase [Maricurvus nonylphenolicus]|uniref:FAD-dependent oxidoreductase n=1 Tax=Maricurvus nonylphenolicus TaxID=1008307 RepID=UPI0036F1E5B6